MGYALTTAPTVEPVTLDQVKNHCRVFTTTEDSQFQAWIKAARRLGELLTGRHFITQSWTLSLDSFPGWEIELNHGPVQSITSITYIDEGGVLQTLLSTVYQLDTKTDPARLTPVWNQSWPATRYENGAVRILFATGYGAADTNVPETIKQAIMLTVAQWYTGREDAGKLTPAAEALFWAETAPAY